MMSIEVARAGWSLPFRALLIDLDGTLVDSTRAILRGWRAWAREVGVSDRRLPDLVFGRLAEEIILDLLDVPPPADELAAHARRVLQLQETDPQPGTAFAGAQDLAAQLVHVPWAIVTGCSAALAKARLRAAGLPEPAALVTADDVTVGKPDPQGYLIALDRLGLRPDEAVVVEDAPVGVRAAKAAGVRVVAVTNTHPSTALAGADVVVESLSGLAAHRMDSEGWLWLRWRTEEW